MHATEGPGIIGTAVLVADAAVARPIAKRATTVCIAILVAVFLPAVGDVAVAQIAGQARVVDGDTLCVAGVKVRLEGMDAPELRRGQRCKRNGYRYNCGKDSRAALTGVIRREPIECEPKYGDVYKRFVAVCRLDGKDISEEMVRMGWAIDWPRYSNGRYKPAQNDAIAAKRGFWADGIDLPPIMKDHMSSRYVPVSRPLPTRDEAKCRM